MKRSVSLISGIGISIAIGAMGPAQTPQAKLKPHPDALPNPHPPGKVDKPTLVPFIVESPRSLPATGWKAKSD